MGKNRRGLTLAELLLAAVMIAAIIGALTFMFQVFLGSWSVQSARMGTGTNVARAVRAMVQDLRGAKEIGSVNANEIRFTKDDTTYYVYYLYNAGGAYQVKKATLSGGMSGTFPGGSGDLVARDILPPPASTLTAGVPAVIDLTAQRSGSTMRSVGKVSPRNI